MNSLRERESRTGETKIEEALTRAAAETTTTAAATGFLNHVQRSFLKQHRIGLPPNSKLIATNFMADDGGVHKRALTSVADLDGILDEILAWLPVKSLMRYRCVCKSWRALISHSYFVTKHFNYASKGFTENTSRLLISMSPFKSLDSEASKDLSLDCEALKDLKDDGDAHIAIRKLEFPVMFPDSSIIKIVGSCNGLICVEFDEKDMVLWNPCTGQSNLLPKCPGQVSSQLCGFGFNATIKFCGFGYDSTNDDYKVVRGYNHRVRGSEETVVQVFSLKSASVGEPC